MYFFKLLGVPSIGHENLFENPDGRTGVNHFPKAVGTNEWCVSWYQDFVDHVVLAGGCLQRFSTMTDFGARQPPSGPRSSPASWYAPDS